MSKRWSEFLAAVAIRFCIGFVLIGCIFLVLVIAAAIKAHFFSYDITAFPNRVGTRFDDAFITGGHYKTLAFYVLLFAIAGGILTVFVLPWQDLPWKKNADATKKDVRDEDTVA
jgi:uncharacterized integral membrane protein